MRSSLFVSSLMIFLGVAEPTSLARSPIVQINQSYKPIKHLNNQPTTNSLTNNLTSAIAYLGEGETALKFYEQALKIRTENKLFTSAAVTLLLANPDGKANPSNISDLPITSAKITIKPLLFTLDRLPCGVASAIGNGLQILFHRPTLHSTSFTIKLA